MAQRHEPGDSLDDFPTPPWATRALMEHVLSSYGNKDFKCHEPACGRGDMSKALKPYFRKVVSYDIHDYGYRPQARLNQNFLNSKIKSDFVITNPPFILAEPFIHHALKLVKIGAAFLVRTTFLETIGRYERLFKDNPPSIVAQFAERVPMVKGRLDKKASTATSYAWLVWFKTPKKPKFVWIPPCRKELEKNTDYE